jgi:restriction endonuclease S subunit
MMLAHTVPATALAFEGTINQDMKALMPDSRLDPGYLCSWLWAHNAELLGLVEKSSHDTRQFETSKLLSVEVPVPSLAVQQRVIAELDALDVQTRTLRRTQAEVGREIKALLPAILDRAFAGAM